MIVVAIGWQVYHLHNDPLDLGLVGLAEFLPLLVLALPAGALADRASRRVIAIVAGAIHVCVAGALLVITVNGTTSIWPYLGVGVLAGAMSAIGSPATRALTPELVPGELLQGAIALRNVAGQIGVVVGPALGGIIFAVKPSAVYVVAGALLIVALMAYIGAAADPNAQRGAGELGEPRRRHPLHRQDADDPRRHPPRPLRRAARRPDRARAGVRVHDPRRRPGRAGSAEDGAVHRSSARGVPDRPQAAALACRGGDARRRRHLRRLDDRLRPLEVVAALARGAVRQRLRGHDQRQHPRDDARDPHAAASPGPRERRRVGLHQRVERARRLRGRRDGVAARAGARGRARRRADDRDRRLVAAVLPGALADRPARRARAPEPAE